MTPKLAIPLVFALSTSTAVLAQDAQTDAEADFSLVTIPFDWDENTVDAFFSDPETGELRDEDDISENWEDLSSEQQEIVRNYCEGLDDEAGLDPLEQTEPTEGADTLPAEPESDLGAPTEPGAVDEPGAMDEPGAIEEPGTMDEPGAPAEPGAMDEPGAVDEPGTLGEMDTAGTAPEMTELCEIVEDL